MGPDVILSMQNFKDAVISMFKEISKEVMFKENHDNDSANREYRKIEI